VKKIFWFLLLISVCCNSLFSQQTEKLYGSINEETWLPHQSVRAMFQDATGNIWVGTNAGLNKYNLFSVTNFNLTKKLNNRLLNNSVRCINEDNFGNILVGTESGLGVLNPKTSEIAVVTENDETVVEIIKGQKGICCYITNSGKIFRFVSEADSKKKGSPPQLIFDGHASDIAVKTIFEMPGGNMLIGAASGLYIFNVDSKKLSTLNFKYSITCIYAVDYSAIWVGTAADGLYELAISGTGAATVAIKNNIRPGSNTDAVNNYIVYLKGISSRLITVATPAQVFIAEKKASGVAVTKISDNVSFREFSITSLLTDKTNNIWIGSRRGLYKMKRRHLQAAYTAVMSKEYKQDNILNDLYFVQRDVLWMLTSSGGLFRFNSLTGRQEKLQLNFNTFRLVRKAVNGNIIILADDAVIEIPASELSKLNPGFKVLAKGNDWELVNDMAEVAPGEWWASSWKNGLLRVSVNNSASLTELYTEAAKRFTTQSHLFGIIKDISNNVWIGTRGEGLVKINLNTKHVTRYNKVSKSSDRILSIKEDSKARIWIGTRGDGLQLYQPATNDFKIFEEKDGLPSNSISSIEENSKGEIWVATLNGVACMQQNQFIPFQSFNHQDGINNAEFSFNVSAADYKGNVYFGSGAGMYQLSKADIGNKSIMPVEWTNFELLKNDKKDGGDVENSSGAAPNLLQQIDNNNLLTLKHNENSFRIGFASLDFTAPEKNRYAYRLVGKDEEWKLLQGVRQQVQYVGLAAGDYVFEVKAANSEGDWSSQSQSVNIHIRPSFWATSYAYILYALIFAAILLTAFLLRRRWYKLNRQLEDEIETGKMHNRQMVFYTDLSHEIKNRLSLLLGPLEQALTGKKVNPQILNNLYEQGLRLKKLTDQIMDIRKSESGSFLLNVAEEDIKKVIQQIVTEATPLAVVKNIKISFISQKENIKGWCDEELLEIVMMNLVNNAIKYCNSNGSVEVKIDTQYLGENDLPLPSHKEGNYLCCTITDTGLGIAKEEIEKIIQPFYRAENTRHNKKQTPGTGIGLDLVARLISKHYGSLDIRSEMNQFTSVSFYLPVDKSIYSIAELKPDIVHAPIIIAAGKPEHINEKKLILPADELKFADVLAKKDWHILVADDNEEVLKLVACSLEDEFSIHKAGDGNEALEVLQQQEIHLIISDLDMPQMDGLTFCRNIRTIDKFQNIPFLILTGRNSEEQKLICFQNQVDDFIEKPFSTELLKWRVKNFLRSSSSKVKLKTVMVVEPKDEIRESEEDEFIQDIINLIEKNIDKDFLDVDFLAENMYSSRATFYRRMEQMVGESPSVFIRKYRLKKAALYLQSGNYSVSEAAYKTGFSNPKYFSKCFQKEFGVTPTNYLETYFANKFE
jgi:signal transduction histidine kinase/DNA-binding response OmpR family regulator/streptogramin lyase